MKESEEYKNVLIDAVKQMDDVLPEDESTKKKKKWWKVLLWIFIGIIGLLGIGYLLLNYIFTSFWH